VSPGPLPLTSTESQDPYLTGGNVEQTAPVPSLSETPIGRVLQAARRGYDDGSDLLTPWARDALEKGGAVSRGITIPAINLLGQGVGAVNALGGAVTQGAYELGSRTDPSLGRDFATLMQVAPASEMSRLAVRPPGEVPPSTATVGGRTVEVPRDFGSGVQTDPATGGILPKPRISVTAATGDQSAQPAGAMVTPPGVATFTPQEIAAYRASAEGRKLMENQEIGVPDRNAYIPGVTVSAAEQELQAELARELKSAGLESPAVSQDIKAAAQRNDQIRRGWLQDTTGDEVSVHKERTQQTTDIEHDKPKVFGANNVRGDVNMEPLLKQIDETRVVPENRQNTELQKVLGDLRNRLTNPDGSPKTMSPQEAWGLRRNIERLTDKRMAADDPALHYEGHQLRTISDMLDREIENMAPGYADMVNTYRTHAQKIEAMEILQDKTRGILSQTTTPMRFSDFQRFMKNVTDMRRTGPTDLNPYKSITEEQMDRLWRLRDDMRRVATASELARAPGSDTVPNIMDMLMRHTGDAAIHGVANYIAPGWGSVAVGVIKQGMANRNAVRAAAQTRARAQELLYPKNQLQDPDAAP
jgi:hypothetical protein